MHRLLPKLSLLFAPAWLSFTISAQSPIELRFDTVPGEAVQQSAFPVRLVALDPAGQIDTTFRGAVSVSARQHSPAPVVMSEVSGDGHVIEFTNPGDAPVDVSGWELEIKSWSQFTFRSFVSFPTPTVVPPRSTFTWSSAIPGPGNFPELGNGNETAPVTSTVRPLAALQLRTAEGTQVDSIRFTTFPPIELVPGWFGPALGRATNESRSLQRVGGADTSTRDDWVTNSPSLGSLNPGMVLPWQGRSVTIPVVPSTVEMANGVWEGLLTTQASGSAVSLVAATAEGRLFESQAFVVTPGPALSLEVPPSLLQSRESTAGSVGQAKVSRPAPSTDPLTVTLALDQPGEFTVPSTLVIPAGATAETFNITNLDDAVADGLARIRLTASAPGLVSAESWLFNDDNEIGNLYLLAPAALVEGIGNGPSLGEVVLAEPARHDVVIHLSADPVLEVPSEVVIPAGKDSAHFPIRAVNDQIQQRHGARWIVRATLSGWPTAEQTIQIFDDDLAPAEFVVPDSIIEGETATCLVRLQNPCTFDRRVTFADTSLRLELPPSIRIPALATEASFTIRVRDNVVPNAPEAAGFQPVIDGSSFNRVPIAILDNEPEFSGVRAVMPSVVFVGEPVPIRLELTNAYGSVARTHLEGRATLKPGMVPTPTYPLGVSNGVFAGTLTFPAAAIDASLLVEVGDVRQSVGPFDILDGRHVNGPFADLASVPDSNRILVLGGVTEQSGSALLEIDVQSGTTNRSLNLPRPSHRLAISDSGKTAWCASTNDILQRVDLAEFSLKEEVNLVRPGSAAFPLEMVVLPGSEDRLVMTVITNLVVPAIPRLTQIIAVSDGSRLPVGTNLIGDFGRWALASGPNANEATIDNGAGLRVLDVGAEGLRFGASAAGAISFAIPLGNLIRVGDRFFRGSGDAFTVSPLTHIASDPQSGMMTATPGHRGYLGPDGTFRVFDRIRDVLLGTHRVPWPASGGLAPRLVATLDGTFAALMPDRSALELWRSPMATAVPADLAVVGQGPEQVPLTSFSPILTNWIWTVTNRGPGTAYRVVVTTDRNVSYDLGTLHPGSSRGIEDSRYVGALGMVRGHAVVQSPTPEANPADNTAEITTAVVYDAPPWTSQWLSVRDMAPSADGALLWIAQTPPGTVTNTVVSSIDPVTRQVTQVLEHAEPIDRLHPTGDGRFLFLRIGTQQAARWNLAERRFDLQITSETGTVLDVLPISNDGHTFVLASSQRLAVYDDGVARPNTLSAPADYRFLTYAADRLWVHESLALVPYRITSQGLEPDGSPIRVASDPPLAPFTSDGHRLYGEGSIVDLDTRQAREERELRLIVPDRLGNAVYALKNQTDLVRLDSETFQSAASQPFLRSNETPVKMTRCGVDALAFRFDSGVLWLRSLPLVAEPGGGDIAVTITAPAVLFPYATQEYQITLTNHSEVAANRIELEGRLGDNLRLSREVATDFQSFLGRAWLQLDSLKAHESRTFQLPILHFPGPMTLEVQARSGDLGDNPSNNLANVSGSIEAPSGNLAVALLSAPSALTAPSEFAVRLRITNSAEAPISQWQVRLQRSPGLELLSAAPGEIPVECCGPEDLTETVLLQPLDAKSSTDLEVRYRVAAPGVFRIGASVEGFITNNPTTDDHLSLLVSAPPAPTTPGLALAHIPPGALAWSNAKEDLLAVFAGHPALVVLDPDDFRIRREIPLPSNPSVNRARLASSSDGRRAWTLSEQNQIVQVNLQSGTVEAQFPNPLTPPESLFPYAGLTFATVPTQPDVLLIAGATEPRETQIVAFQKGAPLPTRYRYATFQHGANPAIHATLEGRLFVLAENQLAEFEVSEFGVTEKRRIANLTDRFGPISSAGSRLIVSRGPAFDLNTLQEITSAPQNVHLFGVPELSLVFRYPTAGWLRDSSNNKFIESLDPADFAVVRRREIRTDDWPQDDIQQELSLGRHGLLLLGRPALRVMNEAAGDLPDADLGVAIPQPFIVATASEPLTVQVSVSHTGSRTSRNTLLEVGLPTDVELLEASAPLTSQSTARVLSLGPLARTNLTVTLVLKTSTLGQRPLQFRVRSDTTDPDAANNAIEASLNVFPLPEIVLRDSNLIEGSDASRPPFLPVHLSHPSPKLIEIPFRAIPLTASPSDLLATEGTIVFQPGTTEAACYFVRPNTQVDGDRTVRIELGDTPVAAPRLTAVVTIVDDETPAIAVRPASKAEGQSGITWALVAVELKQAASEPLEVAYRLESGTATANEDFRPDSGWIRFEPGQTNRTIAIPILGDTRFEAAETVRVTLTDTAGLDWDGSNGPLTITNDDAPEAPVIEFVQVGTQLRLSFGSIPGARYRVQVNNRLGSAGWAFESGTLNGTGQPLTWTIPLSTFGRTPFFYRVRVD